MKSFASKNRDVSSVIFMEMRRLIHGQEYILYFLCLPGRSCIPNQPLPGVVTVFEILSTGFTHHEGTAFAKILHWFVLSFVILVIFLFSRSLVSYFLIYFLECVLYDFMFKYNL